jgi:carbamoyltransferase
MLILGLNTFHPDASAAIIQDGEVVFAIAEERLNRVKHYAGFPAQAIQACLNAVGATIKDVDHVAIGQDADANLVEKIRYAVANPAKLLNFIRLRRRKQQIKGTLRSLIRRSLDCDEELLRFEEHHIEHHIAHIASAFYCSPWEKAAGFSYDGSGDFVSTMLAECQGTQIRVLDRIFLPHSLGSFYTMVSEFIGFGKYGDEGKVMGLAPYGKDTYCDLLSKLLTARDDRPWLDLDFFNPIGSNEGIEIAKDGTLALSRHFSQKMVETFGPPRSPDSEITQRDADLAYALQHAFEEALFRLLNKLYGQIACENLVLAGGCALNSVANGKISSRTPFRKTWIQPAAGDEGLAIGAALYVYHSVLSQPRQHQMRNSYLGPEFSESNIESSLKNARLSYHRLEREPLLEATAKRIAAGDVVGWFQGRMEWGPRALGNRSIIAHPGRPEMKDTLNSRIKRREWFRPFAPSILEDHQARYFEHAHPSPFMLHVYKIKASMRDRLCAVNHVDNTGRLQTVSKTENPLYYDLIRAFERETGIPVVLNTSFNENEPIVCTPDEAIACFERTRMDAIAIGPFLVCKTENHDIGKAALPLP